MLTKEFAYYRTHFREAVQKDGIICLEYGRQFKSLAPHVRKHTASIHDYKAKWGYNRTTSLVALSTHQKLRRNAPAMNFASLGSRNSVQKAIDDIRGRRWPYRPESRLIKTEAARARLAASFRLAKLQAKDKIVRKENGDRHFLNPTPAAVVSYKPCKEDRQILSLRKKGLWLGEIESRLGVTAKFGALSVAAPQASGIYHPTTENASTKRESQSD